MIKFDSTMYPTIEDILFPLGASFIFLAFFLTTDFKQPRRQYQRKGRLKIYVRVTCTTSQLFQFVNLYNVAKLSWNRIGGKGVQVKTENENLPS